MVTTTPVGRARPAAVANLRLGVPFDVGLAMCLSWLAASIHLVAVPTHWSWWRASGVFFLLIGVAQALYALALLGRRSVRMLLAGIVLNVGIVVVYVVSRTRGLPGEPGVPAHGAHASPGRPIIPWKRQPLGIPDYLSLVSELGLILLLAGMLPSRERRWTLNALGATGIVLVVGAWIGVLS